MRAEVADFLGDLVSWTGQPQGLLVNGREDFGAGVSGMSLPSASIFTLYTLEGESPVPDT